MSSESEDLTIFITFFDIYKYKVMLFELINESAFFQHYINDVLFNCLHKFCQTYLNDILIYSKTKKKFYERHWWQRFIEAYDISNRSTSYRAQLYDQNKFSFNSIASQMTASQVKNRKLKFFALTQIKIDDETRVHQRRRKNHQFRQ